jgi:very-short-patch-repair endonuclease
MDPADVDPAGGQVQISVQCMPVVNFALQQNDVPVFREVGVANTSSEPLADLLVEISISGDLARKWEARIARIEPGETVRLHGIDVRLDPGRLANQVEREQVEGTVTVRSGEKELGRVSGPISLLAFNEWPGTTVLQEILAAFVTPNHPAIETLMGSAREFLGQQTGDPSLAGYQVGGRPRAAQMVGAIYAAMRKASIGYINPPASYEKSGQKIRTPAEVLEGSRLGTCLDLAVVAASAIEQAGLNPLLLLIQGHAFAGVWLQDEQFFEPAVDDPARIANRVRLSEILVFEATSLCDGKNIDFESAQALGNEHFKDPEKFLVAIDVKAARRAGIRPLPARVRQGDGFTVIQVVESPGGHPKPTPATGSASDTSARRPKARERKLPANLPQESIDRLETWKRKLLDLSLRNPLVNFRSGSKKVIPLLVPDIGMLEDHLARGPLKLAPRSGTLDPSGPRDLTLERERSGRNIPAEMLAEELSRGLVRADLGGEFDGIVVEIFRAARLALEETGTNTLFLALGSLHWYESAASEERRVSPLVLVPVRLERSSPGQYRLVATDEDTRVNVTLLEKLARDHQIDPQSVYDIGNDETGFDVRGALSAFTSLVKDLPRCEVQDSAHLGLFSFAKFLLYADLDERLEQVAAAPVVRQILDRSTRANDGSPFPAEHELDLVKEAGTSICPVDSDSSQSAAVQAALVGKSFVLQGPPGTGKSQTITNLIARAAFEGKRVLFVAEKQAALSVVQRRLNQAGLGPYVLEVHSSKAGKKELLNQLQSALNAASIQSPADWEAEAGRLYRLRDELNAYVVALHTRRASGETIFEVISRLNTLANAPKVSLALSRPGEIAKDRLAALREAVATAAVHADAVGSVASHPLRGVRITTWRVDLADQASTAIETVRAALTEFTSALEGWLSAIGVARSLAVKLTTAEVKPLLAVAKLAQPQRWSARVLLTEPGWESLKSDIMSLARAGKERDTARAELLQRYSQAYLELDHAGLNTAVTTASHAFVLIRWLKRRQAIAPIRPTLKERKLPDDATLRADLAKGALVRERTAQLTKTDSSAARALGGLLHQGEADWTAVEAAVASAGDLRKLLATYPASGAITPEQFKSAVVDLLDTDQFKLEPGSPARVAAEAFLAASTKVHVALPSLQSLLEISDSALFGKPGDAFLGSLAANLDRWFGGLNRLAEWAPWQRVFRRDDVPELRPLLDSIDAGQLLPTDANRAFEAAFARAWLGAVMPGEVSLRDFTHESRYRQIVEFGRSDKKVQELSRQVISARLASQVPRSTGVAVAQNSEAGILRRQLQLQRNHKPVRKLVKELPTLLPKLKPVWLMSPLSVATYLDPAVPLFDLVVFDEASQIPVWDAVGAIARGAKAVIVGDSKQLPPTDFFKQQSDGQPADDADVEELESILDECLAADLPELKLKWHYRSRHESLIAFSNAQYYEGGLLTFPSADDRPERLGVSMRHLPAARYDRGGSRTNKGEAEAIIDELCVRAAAGDTRTVGIVTFSSAQQMLIEDLFDERVRMNTQLQQAYRTGDEQLFIKNLENVQGDERDVILFSICYGPDENGKVSLGFGPLNRDGGERRLNVAITRARQQVIVFTSLHPDQIDLNRSRAKGLAHLKHFLDYAARGPKALAEIITPGGQDDCESPFESAVCRELRDRGFNVETQVGCSDYRIDLAIRHPDHPGRYLIGIECDGASYHSAKTARDRDRLRQQVLEQLGWTLHRVWSTDWLQNRDRCIERMLTAIEAARTKAATPPAPP